MREVVTTIFVAIVLVVGVVFLFLQTWRASIIPVVAIPVSLVGTFTILAALGISLNNLSLFGLVLAVGIVVDDAIVVVENVERNICRRHEPEGGRASRRWTRSAARSIAIALTLCAVFVPSAFISGISGQFFRQFAVTIAASTVISLLRLADAEPGALRAAVQGRIRTRTRPRRRCWRGRCCACLPRLQRGLRAAVATATAR